MSHYDRLVQGSHINRIVLIRSQIAFSISLLNRSRLTKRAYGWVKEGEGEGKGQGTEKALISNTPLSLSRYRPQMEKDTLRISTPALNELRVDLVLAFQIVTVLFIEHDATNWLSSENETA